MSNLAFSNHFLRFYLLDLINIHLNETLLGRFTNPKKMSYLYLYGNFIYLEITETLNLRAIVKTVTQQRLVEE